MSEESSFEAQALTYHRSAPAGKLAIRPTKPLATQRDLALAYSPGVAVACRHISDDPLNASEVTARANMVGVVSNGTAVLGLGDIGPLASKPVMEGKAVLFKKFGGIDVFDIEVEEDDPDKFVDTVARLNPTFGAINLEDIGAPECFDIEDALRRRMDVPVFHDDQHGTAIIVAAAVLNGLRLSGKRIEDLRIAVAGAGAAAVACLDQLCDMGAKRENILVSDAHGVLHGGRTDEMHPRQARYCRDTDKRSLGEIFDGADVFLGLSAPEIVKPDMVKKMGEQPMIFALANPVPEIRPEHAREARPDAIIGTGRSDYPNQVNNVLCFPFIFRGALDCGARDIGSSMRLACVHALADLAQAEAHDMVASAYGDEPMKFGPDYIIPKPFDPRLIVEVAPRVAAAAAESGLADRPIKDLDAYRQSLNQFVYRSGLVMRPVFAKAKEAPKRLVYAEGEEERVLRAAQTVVDEGMAQPILIGRTRVVHKRIEKLGLRLEQDSDYELVDPESDPRYREYWQLYYQLMARKGGTPDVARQVVRTSTTVIAALMVHRGEADGLICGTIGHYTSHYNEVVDLLGLYPGIETPTAVEVLVSQHGTYFIADTHVNADPTSEEVADIALLAAEQVRRFGITPKAALLSHSNFGEHRTDSALKMSHAVQRLRTRAPGMEVEGEMHPDAALEEAVRERIFPDAQLKGEANLLVMPNVDAANIAYNMTKVLGDAMNIGPLLLGPAQPATIMTPAATVRGIVNVSALCVIDAQIQASGQGRP